MAINLRRHIADGKLETLIFCSEDLVTANNYAEAISEVGTCCVMYTTKV